MADSHLVFVFAPGGYVLREEPGDPPPVGSELYDGELALVVTKVGVSPFPGDPRRCAFTTPR
jgi:hypothetical protein